MAGTNVGRILSAATLIAGVMWGGCTDVNLGAAQYRCSWDGDCPPGSSCDSYGWCSSGQGGWQPDGASPDGNTSDGSSGGGGSYVDTSSGGGGGGGGTSDTAIGPDAGGGDPSCSGMPDGTPCGGGDGAGCTTHRCHYFECKLMDVSSVGFYGCCLGELVLKCDEGALQVTSCADLDGCGFNTAGDSEYSDCDGPGGAAGTVYCESL